MVVKVAVRARHAFWPMLIIVLQICIAVLPTRAQPASSYPSESPKPAVPSARGRGNVGNLPETQVYDPAGARLFSLLSSNAMKVIAPVIYGDFLSPEISDFSSSGVGQPMPEGQGIEPAVATKLDWMLREELLPDTLRKVPLVSPNATRDLSTAVPTFGGEGRVQSVCSDNQLESRLQAGGKFWKAVDVSAMPVQFPPGVFTGLDLGNPPGNLSDPGNPSNVPPQGPARGWCRPPPWPFLQSSPIEGPFLWLAFTIALVGVAVFWLSRGFKMPQRDGDFGRRP